jgi:uncharacterized surface protein with fasciclin (FAS1) repeats
MKFTSTLLPLVALSNAFVIPDEVLTERITAQGTKSQTFLDRVQNSAENVWSEAQQKVHEAVSFSENALDTALNAGKQAKEAFECHMSMTKFDMESWLETKAENVLDVDIFDHPHHRPHPPHDGPHHPPHHHDPHKHSPNLTVYQLIASSKYTTKFTELINEYPDIVAALNSTLTGNSTVFAPTDKAFEKIPHHHKPSKEIIKKIIQYHVSPDFYPAGRVLVTHTIPTALVSEQLGESQRLRIGLGLAKGLNVNFYSRIVAINIFGTNGVVHGVDSLLLPPPSALKIVELFPGEFSTLQLGLEKTGLFEAIENAPHVGGTLFAPSNWAFQKLGPKINAFLFSKYGHKYLKALLEYHVVANQTLYSDAYYKPHDMTEYTNEIDMSGIPKGYFHVDLPTLLKEKFLSIDVARYGGLISMKINGFSSVAVQDGIARDGVVHVVSSVLIPPKTPGDAAWAGEEMTVEEFKDRFDSLEREL